MNAPPILRETPAPYVLALTLNRPEKRNALSNAVILALAESLDEAAAGRSVRCVLLRGSDTVFSAGADIKEMHEQGFAAIDNPRRRAAWERIAHCPLPIVAAIEGIAFGGGHELALLADIVIAARNARFAQPEINIGILPGDGATQRLARIAGKSLTMLMVLTGAPIDAATAQAAGLVAELTEAGQAAGRGLEIATLIAGKSPSAARLAKEAVLAAWETPLSAGLQAERAAIRHAFTSPDQAEGMAAFFEKRPPRWAD